MTRRTRWVALLILLLLFIEPAAEAAKKRRARRRKAAAPVVIDQPSGVTLQERLASLVNGKVAQSSEASIQVVDIESGEVVVERNAHQPLAPASNMKLFTTAAGIDLLKPDFQFRTTVFARGNVDAAGTLEGDVKIVGHGDPTIGGRFHDNHATAVIDEWAADLHRAGVKSIHGNLIFEYGYMDIEYTHPSWPANQLVNWYEAPVASLTMQEGCVQVRVMPSRNGKPCVVQFDPPTSYLGLENSCVTGRGLPFVSRQRGSNTVAVRGGVPARTGPSDIYVTGDNPIHYSA